MVAKLKMVLALGAVLSSGLIVLAQVWGTPVPEKQPDRVSVPAQRPVIPNRRTPETRPAEPDDAIALPKRPAGPSDDEKAAAETEAPQTAEEAGPPAMPERAPPISLRRPSIASKPLGPPPPPETWSAEKIAQARKQCTSLINTDSHQFQTREPIKEGVCGAPAPIRLSAIKLDRTIEIRPAATVTCPLAKALERWMREVIQPQAKALLDNEIIALVNVASYDCRPRNNNPDSRMSYHAFAEALDIAAFITRDGKWIRLIDNWEEDTPRAAFMKAVHKGACTIFGTVLGPDADAAHKSHFHLDMAKRRYGSYCR